MAEDDSIEQSQNNQEEEQQQQEEQQEEKDSLDDESSSDDSDDEDSDSDDEDIAQYVRATDTQDSDEEAKDDDTPESNFKRFADVLDSRRERKRQQEEDKNYVFYEDLFDFPKDPEKWMEEDLRELWADAPLEMTKPGWDPVWADDEDWEVVKSEVEAGKEPPIAPFYLPYRKCYPAIPDNHHDISNPKSVVEELDRIEEFLKWVSYIFPDGSSYEGTVWDDLAHGKGVYVAEHGLVRYEGEWLQNNMEGHGVVEVDIPDREPVPGSKLEAKMRAEGKIISRDFMSPEDREWLEMDIEDSYRLAGGNYQIPFDENAEWIRQFGQKPEKGRYRYAGQWKHGRMHGCGVYEVNERPIFGRFYFGELLEDSEGCDDNVSTLHAGIAEVAAAKARMFINKPDGMIREQRGPYGDPQHPYLYEGEDVWMAPGFINQFYEVPDYWKTYVHEVDEERQMWLNSFYKAPLRIPMPAELEYWWAKDEEPEFVVLKKGPEPDPEDPSNLVDTEDPVILHTPTGRLIDMIEDEEHGVRLFWKPSDGEKVDPDKVEYLPLGFDEFYGRTTPNARKQGPLESIITKIGDVWNPVSEKLEKWREEKRKASEMKLKLIEQELEFIEAELCLEETIEDMENELKKQEQEESKKVEVSPQEAEDTSVTGQDGLDSGDEEEDEDEEDDDGAPTSFGSVNGGDQDSTKNDKGNKPGKSPFSASSLSFASCSMVFTVPFKLHTSFLSWKNGGKSSPTVQTISPNSSPENFIDSFKTMNSVTFPDVRSSCGILKSQSQDQQRSRKKTVRFSHMRSLSRLLMKPQASPDKNDQKSSTHQLQQIPSNEIDLNNILSLHFPINCPGT